MAVSTEDVQIAEIATQYGAEILWRDAVLCADDVGTQQVMRHSLLSFPEAQFACCIYATAPMMTAQDLMEGFYRLIGTPHAFHYIPGWFYWGTTRAFIDDIPLGGWEPWSAYDMEHRYIDINTPEDWTRAEQMYAELHGIKT